VHQSHAAQHIRRLGELNVVVTDDFYAVAPSVAKIKERTVEYGNVGRFECLAGRFLILDDKTEVATVVRRLRAALLKSNELVTQIGESHGVTLAAQFESEETAIESQRFVDIADFQRDMVEPDEPRPCALSDWNLLCQSEDLNG
jgi:hypothetical protein